MPQDLSYGTAYHATVTGAVCITSGNSHIFGVLFQGTATGNVQIWAGTTATATAAGVPLSGVIRAYATTGSATVQSAVYYPFPAYASGGITINVGGSLDPQLTLFWSPVGGP